MSCGQPPGTGPALGVMPWLAAPAAGHATPLDAYLGVMRQVQVLAGLRAELAARGSATGGMVATRLQATLNLPGGPAITCRGGWLCWPAPDPADSGGPVCAVHPASDPAGAADRLARPAGT